MSMDDLNRVVPDQRRLNMAYANHLYAIHKDQPALNRQINRRIAAARTRSHVVTALRILWRGLPAVLRGAALVYFAHGCSQHGGEWATAFRAWGW